MISCSVYNFGPLQPAVSNAAVSAAVEAGAWGVVGRGFGIGLVEVTRGGVPIHQRRGPLGSWYFPTSITAVATRLDRRGDGSRSVEDHQLPARWSWVRRRQASAARRQATCLHLVAANGSVVQFVVGRVAPDEEVGGTEVVMSTAQADSLGAVIPTSVLIYGQFDRDTLESALSARGLTTDPKIRVRRSWDPFDPDSTIGLARTKKFLGEFAYTVSSTRRCLRSTTRGALHTSRRCASRTRQVSTQHATSHQG